MEPVTVLLLLALLFGFYVAWNIGANDVANAVGTSVGSGALTLKKALIMAALFEFSGAFFLGSYVSDTLESGIINPAYFSAQPFDYVYGMLGALLATGVVLQLASFFGLPVSTTHAIVGAVIGFGIVRGGVGAIYWGELGSIAASWVLSPLLGGSIAYLLFTLMRWQIFYRPDPLGASKRLVPWLVALVFFVLTFIILFNGLSQFRFHLSFFVVLGWSLLTGAVGLGVTWLLLRRIPGASETGDSTADYRIVEKIFGYLQIISAACMAFAHGANDVANAIGPLSAIITILQGSLASISEVVSPAMLALGGVGIIVGLATWGWRVIETVGKKITELTPSRGFAAEFGAATTIVLASKLGLPISTTHTLVGAVLGVGFARGIRAINLHTLRDIVVSWMVTIPIGALFSILFFYILRFFFT